MPIYETSFEVNASAERVWEVLNTLDRYAEWNPQIPVISGTLQGGATIRLRLTLPGRPPMDVSAVIQEVQPARLLTWRGHVVAPWLFEGYRKFEIQPLDSGHARVTHVEDVHGVLAPIFSVLMGGPQQASHDALNRALRIRAEASE